MGKRLRQSGLSIVIFGLFFIFLDAESVAGFRAHNEDQRMHGSPPDTYLDYIASGEFLEATSENWESEFLEMGAYVAFTAFLFQKGSAESKKLDQPEAVDRDPRHRPKRRDTPWPVRRGGWILRLYEKSLSLAFLLLFFAAFTIHAAGGARAFNEVRREHGQPPITLPQFMRSAHFWFQSFQNWQSEFLGLGSMIVLSIFLRQRGSAESKPVDAAHGQTGKE